MFSKILLPSDGSSSLELEEEDVTSELPEDDEDIETIEVREPPTRTNPSEQRVQSTRRRKVTPSTSREGPITTVKRKRLDGGGEAPVKKKASSKKRVVRAKDSTKPKTRRVVTHADKVDEDSPSE